MPDLLEQYKRHYSPCDVPAPSGFTWRVRRMMAADWGAIWGNLITLDGSGKENAAERGGRDSEAERAEEVDHQMDLRRRTYDVLVVGIVDTATGEVVGKPPFEEVGQPDFNAINIWMAKAREEASPSEVGRAIGRSLPG